MVEVPHTADHNRSGSQREQNIGRTSTQSETIDSCRTDPIVIGCMCKTRADVQVNIRNDWQKTAAFRWWPISPTKGEDKLKNTATFQHTSDVYAASAARLVLPTSQSH